MSYDVEIGTHREPTRQQVEAWAAEKALTVGPDGGDDAASGRGAEGDVGCGGPSALELSDGGRHLFSLDGPFAAEADDLPEPVAAACLAPRWMLTVNVPYSSPKRAIALGRSLARHLAEANEGAAFDPQKDALIWPRGTPKRVAPRNAEEKTSRVGLLWFVAAARWPQAPDTLLRVLRRHCREAIPTRYGRWEPPPHRLDPENQDAFLRFVLDEDDGDGFWFAARPSFGGSWTTPHAEPRVDPEAQRYRVGRLELDFDGRVLDEDERWREAVVDLFVAAAIELGAFFAAGEVERGWTVTKGNRLYATFDTLSHSSRRFVPGSLWRGLSPMPLWLSWYGAPYRELVAPHLTANAFARPTGLRRLLGRARRDEPRVDVRGEGLLVRLGEQPRPADELGGWPLPPELTYRARPPIVTRGLLTSSIVGDPAQPEDAASVIPPLE